MSFSARDFGGLTWSWLRREVAQEEESDKKKSNKETLESVNVDDGAMLFEFVEKCVPMAVTYSTRKCEGFHHF